MIRPVPFAPGFLTLLLSLACILPGKAGSVEADAALRGYETLSHWHGGPFFEYRRALGPMPLGGDREEHLNTFWAFRPFYAQVRTPAIAERDFLWPLAMYRRRADYAWWRAFFLAYGDTRQAADAQGMAPWSFTVFPLFFGGRDRHTGPYGGFFPLYGEHPHFLLMDNWRFVLWPVWMDYDVAGTHHGAVLWPLVTWKENGTASWGVWPLYSHARLRESDHWYALWPVATWAKYDEDRDTSGAGYSWMFWPVCGRVARARETQGLFLPPLFSYTATADVRRWRLPWPLVEVEVGTRRNRTSVWPFYEYLDGFSYGDGTPAGKRAAASPRTPDEKTRRYLWVIAEDTTLEAKDTRERRFSIFPFFTYERREAKAADGTWREQGGFLRVWPFYRAETAYGRTRRRVLDFVPIRHAEGLDRNWAPFWTFYTNASLAGGATDHVLFWNLITWTSEE